MPSLPKIRKIEGQPAGSYLYTDSDGNERIGRMPPEVLDRILTMPGVRGVTPVRIRELDDSIREDFWPLDDAALKKFADVDGVVHVLTQHSVEGPRHFFVAKVFWERYEEIALVSLNPALSDQQRKDRIKAILER